VLPHLSVHRGRDEKRRGRGERDLGQRVVRETVCEFRDRVGSGRRDEQKIRAIREFDVAGFPIRPRVPGSRDHRIARERLHRERSDEVARMRRHHDVNFGAALHEQAREVRRLEGRDASRDAEDDHGRAHSLTMSLRVRRRSACMMARKAVTSSSAVPLIIV